MAKSFDDSSTPADASKLTLRLLSILVAVPALVLALFIFLYGCNIPYWDEWEEYILFHKMLHHTLTLDDLFIQHNEHRMFFPRLFFIAATNFGPYTDLAELWISWALACLSSLCLWRLARYTGCSGISGRLLLLGVNIMLFNLLAWEDWLWGFQIGFLLPVLWIIAAVWCVSVSRGPMQFFWAALWSTFNTFTVASGFVSWIVLIPLLLFPAGKFHFRWRGILVHLLGLGTTLGLYLHGYTNPGGVPAADSAVKDPVGAINYFLTYVGAPLADYATQTGLLLLWINFIAGLLLVGIYIACAGILVSLRSQSLLWKQALPWLTLSHYGFCCALITTIGRMGFGIDQSLSSRYIVFSSLIPIGLIFSGSYLFPAVLPYLKWPRVQRAYKGVMLGLPMLCLAPYFWTVSQIQTHWQEIYDRSLRAHASLIFINQPSATPILQTAAYISVEDLKTLVKNRSELGYDQKALASSDLSPLADASSPDPASGLLLASTMETADHVLKGWAYLPQARRHADLVIITLPDTQKRDGIVAMTVPSGCDEAVCVQWHLPESTPLDFSIKLPAGTDLTGLKAWSFDGRKNRAYEIPAKIHVETHSQ